MSQSSKKEISQVAFSLVNAHAASIDVASRENWACVGDAPDEVKSFGVFTQDHHELALWLKSYGIQTVAMESTGIYWKSLYLILISYDFEVVVVNPAHVGSLRNQKTDKKDARFIRKLHQAGLLQSSFQPDLITDQLRTYNRHRRRLIQDTARLVTKMQNALVLMNLQLKVVLSDIEGKTGQNIIQAILSGERDAAKLADLADPRVKASRADMIAALNGQWHEQYLFMLKQHWEHYQLLKNQIHDCDDRIASVLEAEIAKNGQHDLAYRPQKKKKRNKNNPSFRVDKYAYQLSDGVDLMQIEGVSLTTVLTIISEVGLDLGKKFPSARHFASWLGLSPNHKMSGGKILSRKSKKNRHHLAVAFRRAANALGRQRKATYLTQFFKRLSYKKGRKLAICATAHKLAIIVYNMLVNKEAYRPHPIVSR